MAVLELNTLSGYQVDQEEIQKLTKDRNGIRKVEVEDKDTRVNIYFDEVRWHCSYNHVIRTKSPAVSVIVPNVGQSVACRKWKPQVAQNHTSTPCRLQRCKA